MQYFEKEKSQEMNHKQKKLQLTKKKVHFIAKNKNQDKSKQNSPKIYERLRSAKLLNVNYVN